ncbi:DUF1214 domain-containing protein [Candidatus Poriferisocius sp.]|uniref:DUF1214 domain-containing protein n=1 Tax=Candidatus Poriferisocius sp. TaxID=3101276 RepID=UPI003B529B33
MDHEQTVGPAAAWREFCDRLKASGDRLVGDGFPSGASDQAEGYRHLSRLLIRGLLEQVEFADPALPSFYRHNDDVMCWGGPNVDNTYWRAPVSADHVYRIDGWLPPGALFVVQSAHGEMHQGTMGITAERSSDDFDVEADGSFSFEVSATHRDGNWLPIDAHTDHISIREYVADWANDEPGRFLIERLGSNGQHSEPPVPGELAEALLRAAAWADDGLVFWNQLMEGGRQNSTPNEFYGPFSSAEGAAAVGYGGCDFKLCPDEAMVVTCDVPEARYWSFVVYSYGWFESLDFANRTVSLNSAQIAADPDGRFRLVVAHRDPGVHNWLDTEGRSEAFIAFRWVMSATMPTPEALMVPFAEIDQHLPESTARSTPRQRADQIAVRRRSRALRFRR